MEAVEKVAEAVLYEGYLLYPYTRSTLKNQQRWTFGGVYPRAHSEASGGDDPWLMQTQCLITGSDLTEVHIKVRFLQIVDRTVSVGGDAPRPVDALRVGEQVYRPWEESVERDIDAGPLRLADLLFRERTLTIDIEAGSSREPLTAPDGTTVGALERTWQGIRGELRFAAEQVTAECYRLTVKITNQTPWPAASPGGTARSDILRRTMISTHTILAVQRGAFISLLDPPVGYEAAAAGCTNIKTWPVLAGEPGERTLLLSSPIILYDYPQIAPESHGNFFDATEIDELLTLSVLTLTDEEKQEMRESDPRGREILERTESLTPEQLMTLHGTIRSFQTLRREEP
jgi:hypothetical protein